jgi:integrase
MRQMLTATKVKALSQKAGTYMSADGGGLYFRKRENSSSWVIRRTQNKVSSFTTIGRFPDLSLAAARKELEKFGDNSADSKIVADLLNDWFDQNRTIWRRPEQMAGYIRRLTKDDPHLVAMNIHSVDLMIVRKSLKNYADSHGNVAANRLMEILKQVFKHAVQVGYLKYSPIVDLTRKVVGGVEKTRERVLTDDEIRLLCSADRHADLFRFLLLTGQRIRESQLARWEHITGDRLFIPATNNKSGRDHWVALSKQVQGLLESLPRGRGKIFGITSETAVQAYLKRWCTRNKIGTINQETKHQDHFTPHDLRRTFATRLNELKVGPHIVEKILNHKMSGVMAVYNQADYVDERVAAMQLWADTLHDIIDS